tara:strand:- start:601 stop:1218 length:618 start_codon:yes stop_codon:yes gene_type:complete
MAEDKKAFVIYCDLIHNIDHLSLEEKGLLFNHLLEYVNDMNPVLKDRVVLSAWKPIERQLKRDLIKFEGVKSKRSNAGKRSAEIRALKKSEQKTTNSTSVESAEQASTNPTVTDTVTVTDIIDKSINNIKYKNNIISDKAYLEITAMQTKSNVDTVLKYLETFEKHLIQTSEQKQTLKDFKSHFTNWFNRQEIKKVIKHVKQRYV